MTLKSQGRVVSRLDQLLGPTPELRRFGSLPIPHQLAMIHYMAVDGEAWPVLYEEPGRWSRAKAKDVLAAARSRYVARFGDRLFGIASIPTYVLQAQIMADPYIHEDFATWESYRAWYRLRNRVPAHASSARWPVILSSHDDETLQDGAHRLHRYVDQGARTIPALFYPTRRHLALHARRRAAAPSVEGGLIKLSSAHVRSLQG